MSSTDLSNTQPSPVSRKVFIFVFFFFNDIYLPLPTQSGERSALCPQVDANQVSRTGKLSLNDVMQKF